MEMVENFMSQLEFILIERFQLEKKSCDCALFVKALDRVLRKIAVFSRILSGKLYVNFIFKEFTLNNFFRVGFF